MRIRKNAKLSPLLFSSMASVPEVLQKHVCQLNQSPWDVIPFTQHANQLESEDDSFTGNASLGDSMGAVESVASMMEESAKLSNNIVNTNDNEEMSNKNGNFEASDRNEIGFENNDDDNDWKYTEQTKQDNYHPLKKAAAVAVAGASGSRRMRPVRGSKKAAGAAAGSGSNPYEFYYYSGFGPLWGKKRRDRGDGGNEGERLTALSPEVGNEGFDYVEDDDEDEEDDGDGGKKRMRKPVKARSLKSLM